MAEYIKLNSDESGGIVNLLNNNLFSSKNKNSQESDKLELLDFEKKDTSIESYNAYKYSNISSIKQRVQENIKAKRERRGNLKMFIYNKENEPLIVLGPEWLNSLIIMISYILFILFYFYFFKKLLKPSIKFYGIILSFINIIFYTLSFILNPGLPPKELWIENYFRNKKSNNKVFSYKICKDCKTVMENCENIEHCKICNICVIGMESHSSLIGKCIGKKNKIYYYCFKFSTFFLILYLAFSLMSIPLYKNNKIQKKN